MRKEIRVGEICYVIEFMGNSFNLFIDVSKSKGMVLESFRDSDDFMFGDDAPVRIWDKTDSANVFKVKSEVMAFIASVLSSGHAPYYFKYGANEAHKVALYRLMGLRIAKKFGYFMEESDSVFHFFKV